MDSIEATKGGCTEDESPQQSAGMEPELCHTAVAPIESTSLTQPHGLIPLEDIIRIRSRLTSGLFPVRRFAEEELALLENDRAFSKIPDYNFTEYSMEPSAIDFVKKLVLQTKPRVMLEFGSGLSSAVLANCQREASPDLDGLQYLSVEQTEEYARQSLTLVNRAEVDHVHVVVAAMGNVRACGIETKCYGLSPDDLARVLNGQTIDFVVVDGPVAGGPHGVPDSRFPTVLLLKDFLSPGAIICLDDALRDSELRVAHLWSQLSFIDVLGMKIVGKGVTVARVSSTTNGSMRNDKDGAD